MTKIIITGSKGRMGQALLNCAARIPELEVVGAVDQGDDLGAVIGKCDAVIDFSFHNATLGVAELCAKHKKAIVIGKGGSRIKQVREAAQHELQEMMGRQVHLFLFVKVRENWQEDPERYREMGLDFES